MTHEPESTFEERVKARLEELYGAVNVDQQVYLPGPRWFCDLVVYGPLTTYYIELENDAGSIREGMGQALGYAMHDEVTGIPMVIVPEDHTEEPDLAWLRRSQAVIIREFDESSERFV